MTSRLITASHCIQNWKTHTVKRIPTATKAAASLLSNTSHCECIILAHGSLHKLPHDFRLQVRLLPWSSKLSVGLALGTWEPSIPSAAMTFPDSSVPLEQWSCQPREEAQQCRRTNFTEAKSRWECYHSEEREITKSHQLKSSDLPQVSFFPTKLNPAKWVDGLDTSLQCIITARCKCKIDTHSERCNNLITALILWSLA